MKSWINALASITLIVDTDAGSDDLLAIGFLLSRPDVRIEAITVGNGLAHVPAGVSNILRIVEHAGKSIPVYAGRESPLEPTAPFPDAWRRISDTLPAVKLPAPRGRAQPQPAADYLRERLRDRSRPVRVLALGPLTNLADAIGPAATEIVIMGGAVSVPGNLGDGGFFKTGNTTAEWNLFVDPLAAERVFRAAAPIRLVPLDATNRVPIDMAYVKEFRASARSKLGRVAAAVLESDRESIEGGYFYAWDPLAAVSIVEPRVVKTRRMKIEIVRMGIEAGRTRVAAGGREIEVAVDADAALFRRVFAQALSGR